jgi:cell wall-associated NlpC family hydrolase
VPQHDREGNPLAFSAGAVRRLSLAAAILAALILATAAPAAAGASEADRVISVARAQLGDPWVWSREGPNAFDCLGLVYYSYKQAGLLDRISGKYRSVRGYWDWFRRRGLASRTNPRRGDLVIWGRGKHMGIYIGNGRAISTLVSGVAIHPVKGYLYMSFTTYLHVRLTR